MKFNKAIRIYANLDSTQTCSKELYGSNSLFEDIRSLQYDVRRLKNYSMRICFDYDQAQYDYYKYMERCKAEIGIVSYPQATPQDFSKYNSFDGFLYDAVAKDYPLLNKQIVASITRKVWSEYKNDKKQIISGERSLRTYGKDQPIPIKASCCKLEYVDDFDYVFTTSLFSIDKRKELGMTNGIRFILRDQTDSERAILNRLLSGEYKLTETQLAYDRRKNHRTNKPLGWYFCIGYSFEKDTSNPDLDTNKILGVDLGITNVLYLGWSKDDHFKKYIPGSEIKKFQAVEEKRHRDMLRCRVSRCDGSKGHGRSCAVRPTERQGNYIHNFKENKNWHYAHFVVDTALEGGFGVIQMEDLSGIPKSEKFDRTWTFYSLQQKIEQLAKENGIIVRKVNPKNTSQMCSRCGWISPDNRKSQSVFSCVHCGYKKNADHNAAMNISKDGIESLILKQRNAQGLDKASV